MRNASPGSAVSSLNDPMALFQVYLLAQMRPTSNVVDALEKLGVTTAEMGLGRRTIEESIALMSNHSAAEPVALYLGLLGPSVQSVPVARLSADSTLAGSVSHFYQLPMWPDFDFVVNFHPDGYVWGQSFARRSGSTTPKISLEDGIEPWSVTREEIHAALGEGEIGSAWGPWVDITYPMGRARVQLGFDFNLLSKIGLAPI